MDSCDDTPNDESKAFTAKLLKLPLEERHAMLTVLSNDDPSFHAKVKRSLLDLRSSAGPADDLPGIGVETSPDDNTVLVLFADGSSVLNDKAALFMNKTDWEERRDTLSSGAVAAFRRLQSLTQSMDAKCQVLFTRNEFGNIVVTSLHKAQEQMVAVSPGLKPFKLTHTALEILKMFNVAGREPLAYEEAARRATQWWRPTTCLARFRAWRNKEKS